MKHEVRVVRRRRGPVVKYYVIQVKDNGTWIDANPGVAGKKHNGYRDLNEALKQVWKYDGSEPEDEVVWTSDGVSDVNVMPIMVCYLSPGERFSVESEYYILTENGAVNLRDGSAHYFAPHEIVYRRRYIDDKPVTEESKEVTFSQLSPGDQFTADSGKRRYMCIKPAKSRANAVDLKRGELCRFSSCAKVFRKEKNDD